MSVQEVPNSENPFQALIQGSIEYQKEAETAAIESILGLKRGGSNEVESSKKLKVHIPTNPTLTLEYIFNQFRYDPIIRKKYMEYVTYEHLIINLNRHKIKITEGKFPLPCVVVSITDILNNVIEISEIGFASDVKYIMSYEELLIEVHRVINCNYNMECYYYIRRIGESFKSIYQVHSKSKVSISVPIPNANTEIILALTCPYLHEGNRGPFFGDPLIPTTICARIINTWMLKQKINILQDTFYFNNQNQLKYFLSNLSSLDIISRSNSICSTDSECSSDCISPLNILDSNKKSSDHFQVPIESNNSVGSEISIRPVDKINFKCPNTNSISSFNIAKLSNFTLDYGQLNTSCTHTNSLDFEKNKISKNKISKKKTKQTRKSKSNVSV